MPRGKVQISGMKNAALSDYSRDNLGYIFQFYNLVPNLTVKENIQVCEYLTKDPLNMDYSCVDLNQLYDDTGFECRSDFKTNILETFEWIKSNLII